MKHFWNLSGGTFSSFKIVTRQRLCVIAAWKFNPLFIQIHIVTFMRKCYFLQLSFFSHQRGMSQMWLTLQSPQYLYFQHQNSCGGCSDVGADQRSPQCVVCKFDHKMLSVESSSFVRYASETGACELAITPVLAILGRQYANGQPHGRGCACTQREVAPWTRHWWVSLGFAHFIICWSFLFLVCVMCDISYDRSCQIWWRNWLSFSFENRRWRNWLSCEPVCSYWQLQIQSRLTTFKLQKYKVKNKKQSKLTIWP